MYDWCVRTFVWNYPGIISQLSLKLAQAKPKDDAWKIRVFLTQDCMLKHDNFKRANRNALIEHDKDNNSRRNYDEVAMQAKVKRVGDPHTSLHQQPPTPLLTWRILNLELGIRLTLILSLKSVHFKKTVAGILFLSKLWYFLFWFVLKIPQFWKKRDLHNCLLKMNGL